MPSGEITAYKPLLIGPTWITSGLPTILPRFPRSAFLASDGRLSGYPTHQDFKKPYSFA